LRGGINSGVKELMQYGLSALIYRSTEQ
jgi:hypothetical protein